jgi:hypothetical protein
MSDDEADDLADEFLQSVLMDETGDYVQRGRRFEALPTPHLNEQWVAAFRNFVQAATTAFETGDGTNGCETRDMDDAAAELRLRGLDLPLDVVEEEDAGALQRLVQAAGSETPELLDQQIDRFLTDRQKPKH